MTYCIFCNKEEDLLPFGKKGSKRKCPECGSLERHRLMCLYLEGINLHSLKILGLSIPIFFKKYLLSRGAEVTAGNIDNREWEEKIDVTNINKDNDSFDIVICSHILEHIYRVDKAISEIERVTKRGGQVIIITPTDFSRVMSQTLPLDSTSEYRKKRLGDSGHWHVFGLDYLGKLSKHFLLEFLFSGVKFSTEELEDNGIPFKEFLTIGYPK